jgi:hypothetical protein
VLFKLRLLIDKVDEVREGEGQTSGQGSFNDYMNAIILISSRSSIFSPDYTIYIVISVDLLE